MKDNLRTLVNEEYLSEPAHRVRWQKTIDFVGRSSSSQLLTAASLSGLDLGDRTPLTASLEQLFGCSFESTAIDLDVEPLAGSFSVITAFEVLEHLYNPLRLLLDVRRILEGGGARLFVSMPIAKPACLKSADHFHEMSRDEALSLFRRAGFRVERSGEFRIRHPLFYLTGFKPLLRAWYEKVQIYELSVSQEKR
ncbi:MAG: methyltransferase domain-containing protein [Chlorobiaceae bacterium]|nr:methyltransferase domain-containing protein [Chlorobiaceae bacterium]